MKFKAKTKDGYLYVRAKASWGEKIDMIALNEFARNSIRGFLLPRPIKKNLVEYSGSLGMSLSKRLKRPISGRDFLMILEQLVVVIQNLEKHQYSPSKMVLDLDNVYFNDNTKEVRFLYLPTLQMLKNPNLHAFVDSIIHMAIPASENDRECIYNFNCFFSIQKGFPFAKVEKQIELQDRSVVNRIRQLYRDPSGILGAKDEKQHKAVDEDLPTGLLSQDMSAGLQDDDLPTGLLNQDMSAGLQDDDLPTGLLNQDMSAGLQDDDLPTGLLNENMSANMCQAEMRTDYYEEATGLLNGPTYAQDDDCATGLLQENSNVFLPNDNDEELGTAPLQENWSVRYPTLLRVLTNETFSVNKPVFRLGKERSYVDCFVNNNVVSRSHADIITRDKKYFVVDLGSKNRTFINNRPIPAHYETEIHDGDRLKLGNEELIFQI